MKLVRYHYPLADSIGDLDRWFRSPAEGFGRLFELAERLGGLPSAGRIGLGADLYEDDENYFARLELPGIKKSDLKIELNDHQLTVVCERGEDDPSDEVTESSVVKRAVTVPEGIDADKVAAKLEDGILTVTLPKSAGRKPREIKVA